ncbi:potassium channel subfamily K member 3-like isoform X2 [Actinia tenebrosa]|nr:potassium channel subfamily K member 3-like isoform X2 [Actinia tenebrosa]
MSIENNAIEEELKNLEKTRIQARNSLAEMQNSTHFFNMTVDQMVAFARRVVQVENELSATPTKWTYDQGYRLTFEIMTTIGYGSTPPKTQTGRLLCVFYTLVGIPIFLYFMKSIGEVLNRGMTSLVRHLEKKVLKRNEDKNVELKVLIGFIIALILDVSLEIIVVAQDKKRDFTVIDAFYCVIITATTVGFGDLTLENELTMIISLSLLSTVLDGVLCYMEKTIEEQINETKGCQCFGLNKNENRNTTEDAEAYGADNKAVTVEDLSRDEKM